MFCGTLFNIIDMFVSNIAQRAIKMSNIQIKIRPVADATKATKLKVRSFKGMFCFLRVSFLHSSVALRLELKKDLFTFQQNLSEFTGNLSRSI